MAITTLYCRHKTNRGWRYFALRVGRRPEAAKNGPFFIRVRDAANKYKWQKHETESAAKEAAELFPVSRQASELGLTVDPPMQTVARFKPPSRTICTTGVSVDRDPSPRMRTYSTSCWRIC